MLPQVEEVLKEYPDIQIGLVDASVVPEIAEYFQVFTVPALLLFVEEKEVLREARFVPIDSFHSKIARIYDALNI